MCNAKQTYVRRNADANEVDGDRLTLVLYSVIDRNVFEMIEKIESFRWKSAKLYLSLMSEHPASEKHL